MVGQMMSIQVFPLERYCPTATFSRLSSPLLIVLLAFFISPILRANLLEEQEHRLEKQHCGYRRVSSVLIVCLQHTLSNEETCKSRRRLTLTLAHTRIHLQNNFCGAEMPKLPTLTLLDIFYLKKRKYIIG
jgi:hypothetical protein